MRQETFTIGAVTCTVAARTRRTTITAALYRQYIQESRPELVAYEQELYLLVPPKEIELPKTATHEQREAAKVWFEQKNDEHMGKINALRAKHPVGSAYEIAATYVFNSLSRVTALTGTAYDNVAGQGFTKEQVLTALESYLDNEDNEFWVALWQHIFKLDMPLTPPQEKPPQFLTEAEKESPLSEQVGESSRLS